MRALNLNHLSGEAANERYHLSADRDLFRQRCPVIGEGADPAATAEAIRQYVHNTYELFEKVFDCLAFEESFYEIPVHKLRHPMIFYYGHTACFYINKLCVAGLTPRINPQFEEMFAIGVDEMSWDDLNEAHYSWPTVHEVFEYRRRVRDRIDEMMTSGKYPLRLPLTFRDSTADDANAFWWVMLMGAEHERIHIETASVHVRELPLPLVRESMRSFWDRCPHSNARAPANALVPIEGGTVSLGRPLNSEMYGWDCDYADGHTVQVAPFKASKYVVSNAEFFAFMKADGYTTQRYWDEEGWAWVQWKEPRHPWFWVPDEHRPDGYALRLQTELIDLPWDWPVELNNLEARAFCNFLSARDGAPRRMLTEPEWRLLFDRCVGKDMPEWGSGAAPGNLNLERYRSSCPVNENQHGELFDVVGNVWQHCEEAVHPYPGFRVHPFYDDFSVPTYDGRHTCMKGGTWVSTGNEATRDARFAFRRHFFQYIGLRYVEGPPVVVAAAAAGDAGSLGRDPDVDRMTDASFRPEFGGIANGCVAIAAFAARVFRAHGAVPAGRAMDLACGAGRVSFELTPHFEEVIGVDYTARRLMPAFALRERGDCLYAVRPHPGAPAEARTVRASDYSWAPTLARATFFQADPTNLHRHLDGFALIVCHNCLERSYRPSAIPAHLLSRLVRGGVLVIGGDWNWDNIKQAEAKPAAARTDEENTYLSDPLITAAGSGDMQKAIFRLLGGEQAVERLPESLTVPVVFPHSDTAAQTRIIQLAAYRKK